MGLLVGWRDRVWRWPRLGLDRSPWGVGVPGDIKVVSTDVLERLMMKARQTPALSANGRPEWIDTHRTSLQDHYIVVAGSAGRGFYRCIVVSGLSDGPSGTYTLDMAERDFHALREVSPTQLVEFAHRYLSTTPMLPLDPSQQEAWERLEELRRDRRRPGLD